MAITNKNDFLSGLAVGLAISEGGGGGSGGSAGRCPRAETEVLFDFGALTDSALSWTVTAAEYAE